MSDPATDTKIHGVDVSPSFGVSDRIHSVYPLVFAIAVPSGWAGSMGVTHLASHHSLLFLRFRVCVVI